MTQSPLAPPEPAPARGQYDRSLTPGERRQLQRERLLYWTAREYARHGDRLTVQQVIAAANVGRNSFYEHFDDLDDALQASALYMGERTHDAIATVMVSARTTIARLKLLNETWFERVQRDPAPFAVLVRSRGGDGKHGYTPAARLYASLLRDALAVRHPSAWRRARPIQEIALSEAVVGMTRLVLAGALDPEEVVEPMREVAVAVFR